MSNCYGMFPESLLHVPYYLIAFIFLEEFTIGYSLLTLDNSMQYRWTALLWACDKSDANMVGYLLERGADVDAQDVRR